MTRTASASAFLEHLRFLAPRRWNGLVAFNYHRIGDPTGSPFDHELWSATVDELDHQVTFLRQNFDVIHPKDLPELQRRGKGRCSLITFDDGYRDNYELALPVLRARGVPAAFFVTTGFVDHRRVAWWDEIAWMIRRSARTELPSSRWTNEVVSLSENRDRTIQRLLRIYKKLPGTSTGAYLEWLAEATGSGRCPADASSASWMSWDMIREMRDAGMAIGGHTASHPVLSRLDRAAQEAEISTCGRRIREELGEPMRWFAYPVGGTDAFNHDTRSLLAAAGVELAFTYYGGYRRFNDWDQFDVRRIAVERNVTGSSFRSLARWPGLMAPPRGQGWGERVKETLRGWIAV